MWKKKLFRHKHAIQNTLSIRYDQLPSFDVFSIIYSVMYFSLIRLFLIVAFSNELGCFTVLFILIPTHMCKFTRKIGVKNNDILNFKIY